MINRITRYHFFKLSTITILDLRFVIIFFRRPIWCSLRRRFWRWWRFFRRWWPLFWRWG
jgi:hypothetical protein